MYYMFALAAIPRDNCHSEAFSPMPNWKSGQDFIGVTLDSDDYGSPTCDLAKLSTEFGTDVIWLSFQSVVDAFQFRHWRAGTLVRSLVFGCYGDEERTWTEADGEPEPWEREAFFDPKTLKIRFGVCRRVTKKKASFERIWREAELLPDRLRAEH